MDLTAESLKTAYPDVYKVVSEAARQEGFAEGQRLGHEAGIALGKTEGATAERARVEGIRTSAGPNIANSEIAALVASLIADGTTTPDQASTAILGAINADLAKRNATFKADGVQIPAAIAPNEPEGTKKPTADAPVEERAQYVWDHDAKIRTEFKEFKNYLAFFKADESGRVRIAGRVQ